MASAGGASGVTDGWVDPLTHLQNSISEEYARLTSECASLRTQQVDLQASSSALREQQAVLSSEVSDLLQQRAAAKKDLEEEQKALDWWRKKEETISIGRRSADVSGRMARTAWLAEARCRTLEAELKDIHASHELDMEGERGIAAGLRDRIGRLEARLRAKEDELKAAKDREKEAGKQAEQGSETRTRDMDRLQAEAGDLKAALKEERRLKGEKEKEVQRLTEAWRDALEENRRQKADTMLSSSRALTPIQQNVPRPRTPPRNSTALYPKSPTPQTPKSLARAYAYLQTRHSESQAQNAHFAEQLLKAQSALKEVHDLHKADKERFLEWRKVEEERSRVRKRKREEKRRERSQVTGVGSSAEPGPDGLVGGGKRRKSEGGRVMVEAPDESAPIVSRRTEKIAEAEVAEAARTSQTIQEDGRDVDRSDLPEEEEEEEEQEYFSPPDVIAPAQVNVIQEPLSMGTMQRLEQASPEKGARPPASSVQHNTSIVTAQTTERQAPIQELYRGRSPAPLRGEVDVDADRSYPTHIASAHNLRASTSRTTRLDRNPPTTRRTSTTPSRSPPRQISRRSTSPHKTPQTTAHVPARTTPWLGGGNLVRTSSKSVLTYTDPFDLSPPEASSAVPGPSRLPANTSKDGNTHHTKPSLIRDRGETSLRKTALTRFPSDVSYTDSPRSRLLGGTDSLVLEGLSPAEKARKLKQLNKLSTSEKREVYRGYKKDGGRYLPLEQVKRPVTDEYEIDPTKNEGRAHAFHDVKRRKEERKCMHGGDCEECQDWYAAIGPVPRYNQAPKWSDQSRHDEGDEEAIRQHQNMVSRHRETWVKPPTPPGFWSIGFPTTQDVEAQNRRADVMEREKEERIIKEAATLNSKWRKKDR